jgi:signal transduction histidine kinase
MFRYFSAVSLACIVVAAASLVALFRHVASREIVGFGEYANVALAEVSLAAVRPATLEFLAQTGEMNPDKLASASLPPLLDHELNELLSIPSVVRVKIYNQHGWVAYSSKPGLAGTDQSANAGVRAALAGRIISSLAYRDAFNYFDQETEEDNLIQTYIPISFGASEPVRGVFEIYVDVNARVANAERALWQIIAAAIVIMVALYLALLAVARLAERIIDQQQAQIRTHAQNLEVLSARMLQQQEDEKKRIAFDLHEGLAQTLAAVKLSVEAACSQLSAQDPGRPPMIEPMVQVVKDAINEVRGLAVQLRPSSIDDLGLAATAHWFCREYMQHHPGVQMECHMSFAEEKVPEPLKIIIYRIMEQTCRAIDRQTGVKHIHLTLHTGDGLISLTIEHDSATGSAPPSDEDPALAAPRERTLLSGGTFDVSATAAGGRSLRATWLT